MRLACIYALLDESREVKAVHLQAGLAVWKYREASACYIFGDALGDPLADVFLFADKHGQRFARCIVPDGLILLHP